MRLLDQHNLSLDDVQIEESRSSVGMEETRLRIRSKWRRVLLNNIALLNGVRMIYQADNSTATLVGAEDDRRVTQFVYEYFEELGLHLARTASRRIGRGWHNAFMVGYSIRVSERLKAEHEKSLQTAAAGSAALIYIGNKLAEADKFDVGFETEEVKPKFRALNRFGYDAGFAAGDSVALNSGRTVGGKSGGGHLTN